MDFDSLTKNLVHNETIDNLTATNNCFSVPFKKRL